ncbi:MAG: hypothetical protein WC699_08025 [Bacteroidales bacterium]|jgi:hypothetical protein
MVRLKLLVVSGWLCLFTLFLMEQTIYPVILSDLNHPVTADEPLSHFNQAGPLNDFYILPGNSQPSVPVPVIREPLFKWKTFLPEGSMDLYSQVSGYPELVQDSWRCPSVSLVLFPYHEFL